MAEEGQANQVIHVKTVEAWKEHFEKGKYSKKLVVADFTASWCGPCRFIAPYFAELAAKTPEAVFLKVDVDELKPIAEEWNIEAMPTLLLLKEGQVVHKIVGAMKEELQQKVEEHKAPVVATT